MVACPPVRLVVARMQVGDLPAVHEIERASFTTPWPAHAYQTELETNRLATYIVLRADDHVVAYAGMWLMVDEAHVTTFAVAPAWRRRHLGERLILALLDLAVRRGAHEATLEVRLSNLAARRLYEKFGFRPVGIRPHYYSDDNEDALIMTTPALSDPTMVSRIAVRRAELEAEGDPAPPDGDAADERDPSSRRSVADGRAPGRAPGGPS
jgi:ribosomal-protein-alanine N-acetyltransferase